LVASKTSISPLAGQTAGLGSESHRAGQVPHPKGVWRTSKRKRVPTGYCVLDSTRTEKRPVEALGTEDGPTVVSTLRIAVEGVVEVRFWGWV
jgi:hypothetical protein